MNDIFCYDIKIFYTNLPLTVVYEFIENSYKN